MKFKTVLITCLLGLFCLAIQAQLQAPSPKGTNVWTVIYDHPTGTLKTFKRGGSCVFINNDTGYNVVQPQTGTIDVVFGRDNEVFLYNPISLMEYGSWVRGTLSGDGKHITVPTDQCLDYNETYDAATLFTVFNYYGDYGFMRDSLTTAVTYTIEGDQLRLEDTSMYRIVGGMQVSNGVLEYIFDHIWNGKGDFETVYQPDDVAASAAYPVVTQQPQGQLATYTRGGNYLFVENNRLYYDYQSGFINVVRNDATGKVYLQDPVFGLHYGSWIEGTLSADGKTVSVDLPQYLYYSPSAGYAVRLGVLQRPESTFLPDESKTQITYTLADGTITLNNFTDWHTPLSAWRTDTKELVALGDYETAYTLFDEPATVVPPAGLAVQTMPMSAMRIVGEAREKVSSTVQVGWQDNDVYIQGLLPALPQSWIKGTLSGNEIVFPRAYMGRDELTPYYFAGYSSSGVIDAHAFFDPEAGTIMFNGSAEFNSAPARQDMLVLYNGLFLGQLPPTVTPPASLATTTLPLHGRSYNGSNFMEVDRTVELGISGTDIYVKGLFNEVPDGWIKGSLQDGKAVFATGQFVGTDKDYNTLIYLVGYDDDAQAFANPTFTYYADEGVYVSDMTIVANGQKTDWFYSSYFEAGLTIGDEDLLSVASLPAGAVVRAVPFVGTEVAYNSRTGENEVVPLETSLRIATVGDEVYLQGLCDPFLPNAWVKGKRDARGNLTLASPQMFGTYEYNGTPYKLYLLGANITASSYSLVDAKLSYNAMRDTYTMQNPIFVSTNKRELNWVSWFQEGSVIGQKREFGSTDFNSYDATTSPLSSGEGQDYINDGDIVEPITIVDAATGLKLVVTPSTTATPNRFVLSAEKGVQLELNGGTLTVEAPSGKAMTQLTLANSLWNDGNTADRGTLSEGEWTGQATSFVVTIAGRTLLDRVVMGDLLAQAIALYPADGTDLSEALAAAQQANTEPTAIYITLADGAHYTVSSPLVAQVPVVITATGNATATIDAAQLDGGALLQLNRYPGMQPDERGFFHTGLSLANVKILNLSQPLVYANATRYLVDSLKVDNCIVHVAGSGKTLFDFSDGGVVARLLISNSTLYADPHHTGLIYSSQAGQTATDAGLSEQLFSIVSSTLSGLAFNKNVFTHRVSNQAYLTYEVDHSIVLDCGKNGQFLKGLNGGVGGKNPTWRVSHNAFLRTTNGVIADVSASETTGDEAEPVTGSLTSVPLFADASAADFTLPATSEHALQQVGDPRWYGVNVGIAIAPAAPQLLPARWYNLRGQRANHPSQRADHRSQRGIFIVDGKKTVLRP